MGRQPSGRHRVSVSPAHHSVRQPHTRPVFESQLALHGCAEDSPTAVRHFFIAAYPRSGTNWLGSLLNLHPHVLCVGEFTFHDLLNSMNGFVSQPGRAAGRQPVAAEACRSFQRLVRNCLRSSDDLKPGARVIGDHTPRRLRVFLPDALYIALFRDGRDVVVSWTFNALARREDWVVPPSIKPLFARLVERFHAVEPGPERSARQIKVASELLNSEAWVRHSAGAWAEQVVDDLDAIARIRDGRLPGRVEVVRYEDLHTNTTQTRDRLLTALQVDPSLAAPVGSQPRTAPGFTATPSEGRCEPETDRLAGRCAGDEEPGSHYRRGVVGDWRGKLSPVAVGWIEEEAGTELATLDYATASRPAAGGLRVAISAG